MACTTKVRFRRIKQMSKLQQRAAIDRRLFDGSNTSTNAFIEHPRWNTSRCVIWEPDIDDVPLTASGAQYFDLLSKKWMIRVENF